MADLARIKANVAKMASQNAPEADIDGYIASEGVSLDDVRAFKPQSSQSNAAREFSDFASMATQSPAYAEYEQLPEWKKPLVAANDILTQFVDVPTWGFKEEIAAGMRAPFTDKSYSEELAEQERQSNASAKRSGWAGTAAQVAGGVKAGIDLARNGLSLGANAASSGGGLGKVALGSAVDGGIMGGLYGLGQEGSLEDRAWNGAVGAGTGAAIGGALPVATSAIASGFRRVVSPFASSPQREAAVNTLAQEGVPVSAGQRTGSNALRYAESELGGSKAANLMESQAEAFTDAAMRRAGGSGRATSDNLSRLKDQIGQQFDDISARNSLKVDRGIVNDMNAAHAEYARVLPPEQRKIFTELGDSIVQRFKAGGGVMSGKDYQTIRSRLSRMANNYRQRDPEFSEAIRGLRNALDNGMDRSIKPGDAGAWAQARKRYGNLKTLEKAAVGGGEESALGLISPAQLRIAAAQGNRGAYARGDSDFAELAKAGQAVMTKLPNSGTAARSAVRNLGIPGASAGVGGLVAGIPGAVAGAAIPFAAGRALMSKPVQAYLGNQLAAGGGNSQLRAAIARLLLTGGLPTIADGN